jgi:hypothetical protein
MQTNRTTNALLAVIACALVVIAVAAMFSHNGVHRADAAPLWTQTDWVVGDLQFFKSYYNDKVAEGFVLVSFVGFYDAAAEERVYMGLFGK